MISDDLTLADLIAGGCRIIPMLGEDKHWYFGVYCFNIPHIISEIGFATFLGCREIAVQTIEYLDRLVQEEAVEFHVSYRNGGKLRSKTVPCLPSDNKLWRNTIDLGNGYKANRAHLGMIGHVKDEIVAVEGQAVSALN